MQDGLPTAASSRDSSHNHGSSQWGGVILIAGSGPFSFGKEPRGCSDVVGHRGGDARGYQNTIIRRGLFGRGGTDDRDGDVMGRVDGHRRGHGGRRRLPRLRPSAGGMGHAGGREGPLRSSSARLFVELSGERNRRCERRAASDRSSASTALSQSGDHRLTLALVMVTSPTPMVGRVSSPHVARLASETPAASA
jgi:hypothetical protein